MKSSLSILVLNLLLLSLLLGCSETAANKDLSVQTESKSATNVSPDALNAEPASTAAQVETKTNNINVSTAYSPNKDDATLLLNLIKKQQNLLVKKSCGELAYECFTYSDLNSFKAEKKAQRAVENIKADEIFNSKVLPAVKTLTQVEWQALREEAKRTRRPTWAEQGAINCKGQTDAGAEAETMVANAIILFVDSRR